MSSSKTAHFFSQFWRPRQLLLEAAACMALGIVLSDWLLRWGSGGWVGAAILAIAAGIFGAFNRASTVRTASLWLTALMLGVALHGARYETSPARLLALRVAPGGTVFAGSGVIDEPPVPGRHRVSLRLESGAIHGDAVPTGGRLLLQWPGSELPEYGDRVEFRGTLRNLTRARNPGSFDTLTIRKRQGYFSEVGVRYHRDVEVIAHGKANPVIALALRCRKAMEQGMAAGLEQSPEIVQVIQSTVLGTQADASEEILDLFRHTGTIHLFSVSGLHVAMLAAMLFTALRLLRVPRRVVALLVIPTLWGYCFITGLPPGSIRATIMGTVAMLGIAVERPALSWTTLGAAALGILLADTDQLFRPGFQLSFLLVAALLLGAQPMQERLIPVTQPDPYLPQPLWSRRQSSLAWVGRHTMASLSVSLVAWISAIPVTLWYFHLWSPATVPANLAAVALSWFILALGLASGVIAPLWASLALWLNQLNALFTQALLGALAFFSGLPGAHRFVEWPRWETTPVCEIEALDLAGGGAIFIRLRSGGERRDWLIDCGSASQFRWQLMPYLRSRGVNALHGLVLTHGDSRHVGGGSGLMERLPVTEVLDSVRKDRSSLRRGVQDRLDQQGQGRALVQAEDRVTLAPGAILRVLHPSGGAALRMADDKALVLRLDLTLAPGIERRILFTSDAGFPTSRLLLKSPKELRADIWFKGMHASDNLGMDELYNAIDAKVVVVASAPFPKSQQPSPEWGDHLEAAGARLFLQHETGAVRLTIDATGHYEAAPFVDGVDEAREASGRFRSSNR